MKFGPCPTGETDKYVWEQTLCPAGHQDRVSHHNPDHDHDQEQDHDQDHDQYRSTPPESFESFTVFELLHASSTTAPLDQERRGLETRRMFARLAPQVTENPVPYLTYFVTATCPCPSVHCYLPLSLCASSQQLYDFHALIIFFLSLPFSSL
jgi:hypothetical protein